MFNITLFQFFHWYYPNDGSLWKHCTIEAGTLARLGVTHVWLPPAYKSAMGQNEPGYAVYDLFDLGEFDQKGSVPTKYGTKQDYIRCIEELHKNKLGVLADVVLNHKMGGDETEMVKAKAVNSENRNEISPQEEAIEAYTKFTFPGRKQQYSNFIWDWHCFTGVSITDNNGTRIYSIVNEYGDNWEEVPDDEKGNFDYLMGSDIEFRNPAVRDELKWWGKWYIQNTGIDGFRLDAVKHMNPKFVLEWLEYLRSEFKKDFFCIAELWTSKIDVLKGWVESVNKLSQTMDVPLHNNLHEASVKGREYDLSKIFDGTLVQALPEYTITFVDNHDSQPFQGLESFVEFWFKPLAYALILLRESGIPCVFYPSLYGAVYEEQKDGLNMVIELSPVYALREMMVARRHLACGSQTDYFDDPNIIGWTRAGIGDKKDAGLAVVMSNTDDGKKHMSLGKAHANAAFIDITHNRQDTVTTNENGEAEFHVNGGTVSVWVRQSMQELITKESTEG